MLEADYSKPRGVKVAVAPPDDVEAALLGKNRKNLLPHKLRVLSRAECEEVFRLSGYDKVFARMSRVAVAAPAPARPEPEESQAEPTSVSLSSDGAVADRSAAAATTSSAGASTSSGTSWAPKGFLNQTKKSKAKRPAAATPYAAPDAATVAATTSTVEAETSVATAPEVSPSRASGTSGLRAGFLNRPPKKTSPRAVEQTTSAAALVVPARSSSSTPPVPAPVPTVLAGDVRRRGSSSGGGSSSGAHEVQQTEHVELHTQDWGRGQMSVNIPFMPKSEEEAEFARIMEASLFDEEDGVM